MAKDKRSTPPLDDAQALRKLQGLALDQAEQELENKTASSQIVNHFLITGSEKYAEEVKKLRLENQLLVVKIKNEESGGSLAEALDKVLTALTRYKPEPPGDYYVGP